MALHGDLQCVVYNLNVARLVRLFDFQKFYFKLSLKNIKKEKKGKQFKLK